jgi:DNA invertase Pin-like site-specific DNA recombinase
VIDGLVLGMKGTFAQAERHIIRTRLLWRQAQQGAEGRVALSVCRPASVHDDNNIALDPDLEVRGAVRTVFELFEKEGTAFAVVRRFNDLGLRFPRRSSGGAWDGKLVWGTCP